jgi:hypothetical protein
LITSLPSQSAEYQGHSGGFENNKIFERARDQYAFQNENLDSISVDKEFEITLRSMLAHVETIIMMTNCGSEDK